MAARGRSRLVLLSAAALLALALLALLIVAASAAPAPSPTRALAANHNDRRTTSVRRVKTTRRRRTTTPGAYRTVSLKVRLFDDRNGNGRVDGGEPGYANRNVLVIRPQPKNGRYVRARLRTDADGWASGRMVIMPSGTFVVARAEAPATDIASFEWPKGSTSPVLRVPLIRPRNAGAPVKFAIGSKGLSCGVNGCTVSDAPGESFQPLCPPELQPSCNRVYLRDSSGLCLGVRGRTAFTLAACPTAPRRLMGRQTVDFQATLNGGRLCYPVSGVCMGEEGSPVPTAQAPTFTVSVLSTTTATQTPAGQGEPTTTATQTATETRTMTTIAVPTTTIEPFVLPTTTATRTTTTSTSTAAPTNPSCARSTDCPVGTCVGGTPVDVSAQVGVGGPGQYCPGVGEGTGLGFSCSILVSGAAACGSQCASICAAENLAAGNRFPYPYYASVMFNSVTNQTFCGCAFQCGPVSVYAPLTTTFYAIPGVCNASLPRLVTTTAAPTTKTQTTAVAAPPTSEGAAPSTTALAGAPTTTLEPPVLPTTTTAAPTPASCARSSDCAVGTCVGGDPVDVSAQVGVGGPGQYCPGVGEGTGLGFSCSIPVSGAAACGSQCASICAAENLAGGNRFPYPYYASVMFNSVTNQTFCGCAFQCGPVSVYAPLTTTFYAIPGVCNASIPHLTTSTRTTATATTAEQPTTTSAPQLPTGYYFISFQWSSPPVARRRVAGRQGGGCPAAADVATNLVRIGVTFVEGELPGSFATSFEDAECFTNNIGPNKFYAVPEMLVGADGLLGVPWLPDGAKDLDMRVTLTMRNGLDGRPLWTDGCEVPVLVTADQAGLVQSIEITADPGCNNGAAFVCYSNGAEVCGRLGDSPLRVGAANPLLATTTTTRTDFPTPAAPTPTASPAAFCGTTALSLGDCAADTVQICNENPFVEAIQPSAEACLAFCNTGNGVCTELIGFNSVSGACRCYTSGCPSGGFIDWSDDETTYRCPTGPLPPAATTTAAATTEQATTAAPTPTASPAAFCGTTARSLGDCSADTVQICNENPFGEAILPSAEACLAFCNTGNGVCTDLIGFNNVTGACRCYTSGCPSGGFIDWNDDETTYRCPTGPLPPAATTTAAATTEQATTAAPTPTASPAAFCGTTARSLGDCSADTVQICNENPFGEAILPSAEACLAFCNTGNGVCTDLIGFNNVTGACRCYTSGCPSGGFIDWNDDETTYRCPTGPLPPAATTTAAATTEQATTAAPTPTASPAAFCGTTARSLGDCSADTVQICNENPFGEAILPSAEACLAFCNTGNGVCTDLIGFNNVTGACRCYTSGCPSGGFIDWNDDETTYRCPTGPLPPAATTTAAATTEQATTAAPTPTASPAAFCGTTARSLGDCSADTVQICNENPFGEAIQPSAEACLAFCNTGNGVCTDLIGFNSVTGACRCYTSGCPSGGFIDWNDDETTYRCPTGPLPPAATTTAAATTEQSTTAGMIESTTATVTTEHVRTTATTTRTLGPQPTGYNVSVVAGQWGNNYDPPGDGGPATSASLRAPRHLCLDAAGNIYFPDTSFNAVRKVDRTTGIISLFAGTGQSGGPIYDDGPATGSFIDQALTCAFDGEGNMFFAEAGRVRKVFPNGTMTTFAGYGLPADVDATGPPRSVAMMPRAVAVASNGDVYIATWTFSQSVSARLRRVSAATGNVTTVANFDWPVGINYILPEADGSLLLGVSDLQTSAGWVLRQPADGSAAVRVIGTGQREAAGFGDGGPAGAASFSAIWSLVKDSWGNLYIPDLWDQRIRIVAPDGTVSTLLGSGGAPVQVSPNVMYPSGVAFDAERSILYWSEVGGVVIRKADPLFPIPTTTVTATTEQTTTTATTTRTPGPQPTAYHVTIVAGQWGNNYDPPGDGGPATSASLRAPRHLCLDAAGNIYFPDTSFNAVRKVDRTTGIISLFAGTGQSGGPIYDDGPATGSFIDQALTCAFDGEGNMFFAEAGRVRKVFPNGTMTTFAGYGLPADVDAAGPPRSVAMMPRAVAVASNGDVYIATWTFSQGVFARLRRVSAATGNVTTVANFDWPVGINYILPEADGSLLLGVSDQQTGAGWVLRQPADGSAAVRVIGTGQREAAGFGDGGPADAASFSAIWSLVKDSWGNLYIPDLWDQRIRIVAPDGTVSTWLGSGGAPVQVSPYAMYPSGLAFDAERSILYWSEVGGVVIRKAEPTFPAEVTTPTVSEEQTTTADVESTTATATEEGALPTSSESASATATTSESQSLTATTSESQSQTATTSQTASITSYPMTVTPTLHPSNTILRADCTYLPVPYVLADASKTAANTFQIELVSCSPNKTFDSHFVTAAQKWMSVITADVSNINAAAQNPNPLASCVGSNLGTNVMSCPVVDDLIIAFTVEAIDGPFGVLGQAGPALSRPNSVPVTGYMRFDIDDVDRVYGQGVLEDLILHEMGHVLGIGTLWKGRGLLSPSNCSDYIGTGAEPAGARFTGAQANASLSVVDPSDSLGLGYVPVEDKFNQTGTTCSHWKEDAFKRELMTGFLSDRGNPLSVVTVRSLADLGYTVDINSPAIDSTFDLATATQDEMPGAKPEVVLPLVGCLGHGAEPVELPGYLFGKG